MYFSVREKGESKGEGRGQLETELETSKLGSQNSEGEIELVGSCLGVVLPDRKARTSNRLTWVDH